MGFLEHIKLLHRAYKYRYVDDKYEIAFLLQHLREGDTVFDIGAHKGGYTYWMDKAVGIHGKVVAFEPQPPGAELLQQLFPHLKVAQLAVSDKTGETVLYVKPQSYEVSFEASLSSEYPDAFTQRVKTITLDEYCSRHLLRPRFLKIDVEGHELEVLKGAEQTLRSHRPYLLIEIENRHVGFLKMQNVFELLTSLGYWGSFYWKGQRQPLKNFDHVVHQSVHSLEKHGGYANNFMFEPKDLAS
jgi:FkbM family methyltransferase